MELTTIFEFFANFGLPAVLLFFAGWFIYKLWKQSVEREKVLMQEITENRLVNAKAIETITLYAERLGHIEVDLTEIKTDVAQIKENIK